MEYSWNCHADNVFTRHFFSLIISQETIIVNGVSKSASGKKKKLLSLFSKIPKCVCEIHLPTLCVCGQPFGVTISGGNTMAKVTFAWAVKDQTSQSTSLSIYPPLGSVMSKFGIQISDCHIASVCDRFRYNLQVGEAFLT